MSAGDSFVPLSLSKNLFFAKWGLGGEVPKAAPALLAEKSTFSTNRGDSFVPFFANG